MTDWVVFVHCIDCSSIPGIKPLQIKWITALCKCRLHLKIPGIELMQTNSVHCTNAFFSPNAKNKCQMLTGWKECFSSHHVITIYLANASTLENYYTGLKVPCNCSSFCCKLCCCLTIACMCYYKPASMLMMMHENMQHLMLIHCTVYMCTLSCILTTYKYNMLVILCLLLCECWIRTWDAAKARAKELYVLLFIYQTENHFMIFWLIIYTV